MERKLFLAAVFRHREALLLALGVPLVISALRGGGLAPWSALLGTALAFAGVVLRLATMRRIGRGARVFRAHASAGLVAAGPYRWSRNPLYLAAALMLCGLGLIAGAGWVGVALFPATLLAYTPVVLAEERALADLLGDAYRSYAERVPRWIGVSRCAAAAEDAPRVAWSEVFRREKGLVPGIAAAVLAVAAVRSQWLPTRAISDPLERAVGVDLASLVTAAALCAIALNAIKVERHQRRRRASRSVSGAVGQPQLEAGAAERR